MNMVLFLRLSIVLLISFTSLRMFRVPSLEFWMEIKATFLVMSCSAVMSLYREMQVVAEVYFSVRPDLP